MTDNNHDNLTLLIGELKGQVSEGFRGVHQRQDTTNGRLKGHDQAIDSLQQSRDNLVGEMKAIKERKEISLKLWSIVIAAGGFAMGLVGAIATWINWIR